MRHGRGLLKLLFCCGLVGIAVPTASQGQTPPCWVQLQSCSQWPAQSYLTGHGEADMGGLGNAQATEAATSRAYADLARQLRVDVNAQLWSTAFEHDGQGGDAVRQDVRLTARFLLEGVAIREQWADERTSTLHVLAVLDRGKFGDQAAGRIRQEDETLQSLLEEAERRAAEGDPFAASERLRAAGDAAADVEARIDLLRLVAGQTNLRPARSSREIRARIQELRSGIVVAIRIGERTVRDLMAEALSRRGTKSFGEDPAVPSPRKAVLAVEGEITVEPPSKLAAGLFMCKTHGALRLVQLSTGLTLGAVEREAKGAGKNADRARSEALRQLGAELGNVMAGTARDALERLAGPDGGPGKKL